MSVWKEIEIIPENDRSESGWSSIRAEMRQRRLTWISAVRISPIMPTNETPAKHYMDFEKKYKEFALIYVF